MAATNTGGTAFEPGWGTLTVKLAGGGAAPIYAPAADNDDPRAYALWTTDAAPLLQYSQLTAQGVTGGGYSGIREAHLVQDDYNRVLKVGTKYYMFFARRSTVVADKLDTWRGESASKDGPFSNFVQSYVPPGTVRLGYPGCTMRVGTTYYQWLSYGWDTSGTPTPGLTVYHRTSTDLTNWSTPAKSFDPSIWTDGGGAMTDAGNPWVVRCADGVYWLVVEAQRTANSTGWKCVGAIAASPAGPWTACNGGLPLLKATGASDWDSAGGWGDANPKAIQLPGGDYVIEFNGSQSPDRSDGAAADWGLGWARSSSRNGPFAKMARNPFAGKTAGTYGVETCHLSWDENGTDIFHLCQRFETNSSTAKAWRLRPIAGSGGLLLTRSATDDAAFAGGVLDAGPFAATSTTVLTSHEQTNATPCLLGVLAGASVPDPGTSVAFGAARVIDILRWSADTVPSPTAAPGAITLRYVTPAGVPMFWNGTSWSADPTGRAIASDGGREVLARIVDDGTNYQLSVKYADDLAVIASASVPKSSARATTAGRVLWLGDPNTDGWLCGLWVRKVTLQPS